VRRTPSVKIHPIGIDRLHIPSLTCGHHKVVGQISVKSDKVGEGSGEGGIGSSVVVLIIQNHLRRFRGRKNSQRMEFCSAIQQWDLRRARRVREWYSVVRHLAL